MNPAWKCQWDPLYEIYVQDLIPKTDVCKPWRYTTPEYLKRKDRTKQRKDKQRLAKLAAFRLANGDDELPIDQALGDSVLSDSSSEDEDDEAKYQDCDCFWDTEQLEKM